MPTLKDLLHLQEAIRGLIIQVITCPTLDLTRCVTSVAQIIVPSCTHHGAQLHRTGCLVAHAVLV